MADSGRIFVAGSVHLDVLARASGADSVVDKMGRVSIQVGGTACNIATALASLGLKPILLTALHEQSPYSSIITEYLRKSGVDVRAVEYPGTHTAVFSAHIDSNGEMQSAVSSIPVESATFPQEVVREGLEGASCAILDCNLSQASLDFLASNASEMGVPIFVACVSQIKGLRVLAIKYPLAGVFMNDREAEYLASHLGLSPSLVDLGCYLQCPLIVSGRSGVYLIEDQDLTEMAPIATAVTDYALGGGDALLAATLAFLLVGRLGFRQSLERAVTFAAGVLGKQNCNSGSEHVIEDALNALGRLAARDVLTGLANRREGERVLAQTNSLAARTQSSYAVLMVDNDQIKCVNDVHGHSVGDEAIRTVSNVLLRVVRDFDVPCRWGGEEFLCILSAADINVATVVAQRIRAEVESEDIPVAGHVTVSIGIAVSSGSATNCSDLVVLADRGLYEAKRLGRNQCFAVQAGEVRAGFV